MRPVFQYLLTIVALSGNSFVLAPSAAAEADADLSKYCRTTFPNSSPTIRAPSGAIAHYCNQGGTLQGIDLARACELTTGSRNYRVAGDRVLCEDGPGPSQAASGEALDAGDFVRYCRTKFPNSTYQPTPGNFSGNHSCRQVGGPVGFTLHPIDLADLCKTMKGADGYREDGFLVACISAPQTADARRSAAGTPTTSAGDSAPRPAPSSSNPPAPPSPEAGSDDARSTESTGNKSSSDTDPKDAQETSERPEGVWKMTAGVLEGMKVRFDWEDGKMTARITELPAEAAATARQFYDLSVGDDVAVGRMMDGKLQLRTRLGLVGARQWIAANCSGNLPSRDKSLTSRWTLPGWYPVFQLTWKSDRIDGRHGGLEYIVPKDRPAGFNMCVNNNAPFSPDAQIGSQMRRYLRNPIKVNPEYLLPKWAIKFELEADNACSEEPKDAPPPGLTRLFNEHRTRARQAARAQLGGARP